MFRLLILILAVNLVIVGFVLAAKKPARIKAAWTAALLLLPLIGLAIYYFFTKKDGARNPFADWEKK
ncbi:MAG: hypothetical protein HGA80_02680 [Candidatus Omnitrophica bacterium]|nr:hypothetical protein [Candidatus Omnitrophota bacterium]